MDNWIKDMFGTDKALIGLCHFLALPGDPRYDPDGGIREGARGGKEDVKAFRRRNRRNPFFQ